MVVQRVCYLGVDPMELHVVKPCLPVDVYVTTMGQTIHLPHEWPTMNRRYFPVRHPPSPPPPPTVGQSINLLRRDTGLVMTGLQ